MLILCSYTENSNEIVDYVDKIEINHYYNEDGKLVIDQIIFYDTQRIIDWRLIEDGRKTNPTHAKIAEKAQAIYIPDWIGTKMKPQIERGKYVCRFYDKRSHVYRKVIANDFIETSTDYDRETRFQDEKTYRKGLTGTNENFSFYNRVNIKYLLRWK